VLAVSSSTESPRQQYCSLRMETLYRPTQIVWHASSFIMSHTQTPTHGRVCVPVREKHWNEHNCYEVATYTCVPKNSIVRVSSAPAHPSSAIVQFVVDAPPQLKWCRNRVSEQSFRGAFSARRYYFALKCSDLRYTPQAECALIRPRGAPSPPK
jgi:hypothetical protein